MSKWLTSKEFREKYKLTSGALWARVHKQKTVITKQAFNKTYYLDETDEIQNLDRNNVIYCRVSGTVDKTILDKQIEIISEYCLRNGVKPDVILSDIGLGDDNKRTNFKTLIKMIINKEVMVLYYACPDIISTNNYDLIEYLCELTDTKLENLNYNCER